MPTGPSSSTAPYILASEPNVRFVSITTTGDPLPGGGVFGGIPDGIGAFDNGDGTITVLVNHEIRPADGLVRDHGAIGAYVDRLVIDKRQRWRSSAPTTSSSRCRSGTTPPILMSTPNHRPRPLLLERPCRAERLLQRGDRSRQQRPNLSDRRGNRPGGTRLRHAGRWRPSRDRVRAALPRQHVLRKPRRQPLAQDKTIVISLDDGLNGQVYIYVGDKQATGTEIEKAGLSGGLFLRDQGRRNHRRDQWRASQWRFHAPGNRRQRRRQQFEREPRSTPIARPRM